LSNNTHTWLVTGAAGFIGSNLVERLIKLEQKVIGIDNFSTGFSSNIDSALENCPEGLRKNFSFIEGDIRDLSLCLEASKKANIILHQAALGSVVRSIDTPLITHDNNVNGTLNIFEAARINNIKSVVYASSSSVYGDSEILPKKESHTGKFLSPYALTKHINEKYAEIYAKCYKLNFIGLRYFNVFGPRQNEKGPYAAVIPIWINNILNNNPIQINGDGTTSRDFTYIDNVLDINIKAALKMLEQEGMSRVYNCGAKGNTTLQELAKIIQSATNENQLTEIIYKDFRVGDIMHSFADVSLAEKELDYQPKYSIEEGLKLTINWYKNQKNQMVK
jgi:UDP-N-acetylglucosamine 4-epimerase